MTQDEFGEALPRLVAEAEDAGLEDMAEAMRLCVAG